MVEKAMPVVKAKAISQKPLACRVLEVCINGYRHISAKWCTGPCP